MTYDLRLVVVYECETWSTTQGDDNKLLTFERKILRKMFYTPILVYTIEEKRRLNQTVDLSGLTMYG